MFNRTTSLIMIALASYSTANAETQMLTLQLRDGSSVVADVTQIAFQWTDVDENSDGQTEKVLWSRIRELTLIESQVGEQVDSIRRLLAQLTEPEYFLREQAELKLSDASITGPFESLIRRYSKKIDDEEAIYRLNRILDVVSDSSDAYATRFDEIVMKDGTRKSGDAKNFLLDAAIFGDRVQFDRKQVLRISTVVRKPVFPTATPSSIHTFNTVDGSFYDNEKDVLISFETDRYGNPIPIGKNVNGVFADQGLIMETESAGFIQAIKYPFKFCPIDSGNRCVCPYDENTGKRLRGATIISFCSPGQPNVVAGVHKFGLFLERVEHSRDFVVEAFNSRGQLVGMVEATDQICVFAGFKSNRLITNIRIASNKDLPELERAIDETYAFDCITFDEPVAIDELARSELAVAGNSSRINLTTNDSMVVGNATLSSDHISYLNPITGKLVVSKWNDVASIGFPATDLNRIERKHSMMVQFHDGSIVKTEANSVLSAFDFVGHKFSQDQIVGIWNGTARLPNLEDFESGKPIIVFPSCRIIAADFQMQENGFSWNLQKSEKRIQDVLLADEKDDIFSNAETIDPDLTPQIGSIDYSDFEQPPALWFSQPKSVDANNLGQIHLNDGQYFVLGVSGDFAGFRLKRIEADSIVIELDGKSKAYPISRVVALTLPKAAKEK